MKVFISWSGETSRKIAGVLYEWLPMVVQSVQPYMSSESIEKGTRWATSVANELEGTNAGIIVMTPENTESPWIHFEAGALSKVVGEARLAPLLCGLKPSDIGAPLSQFQVTQFSKDDVLRLLKSINGASDEEALPEARLERMLDALWDDLQRKVQPIIDAAAGPSKAAPKKPEHVASEILEEILTLVRQQANVSMAPERVVRETVRLMLSEFREASGEIDERRLWMAVKALRSRWTHLKEQLAPMIAEGDEKGLADLINRVEVVINDLLGMTNPKNRRNRFTNGPWVIPHHQNALMDLLKGADVEPTSSPEEDQ